MLRCLFTLLSQAIGYSLHFTVCPVPISSAHVRKIEKRREKPLLRSIRAAYALVSADETFSTDRMFHSQLPADLK